MQGAAIISARGFEFEKLVGEVLKEQGYRVTVYSFEAPSRDRPMLDFDILAVGENGIKIPVEVKFTSRDRVSIAMLRDSGAKTARWKAHAVSARPLLVYGASIERSMREWAESEFDIDIWDRDILLTKSKRTSAALEQFFQGTSDGKPDPTYPARENAEEHVERVKVAEANIRTRGEELIETLKAVPSGKTSAKAYEQICQAVIDYIFVDDLRDVRSQKRTVDGLNFYDLIYRVRPTHPFWATLTRDFRARVVLFECKNYGKPIGPMQVFSTERYLSASALRPICFVLSRKPANDHAIQAAYGAMRESGKLLVFLCDEDLEAMLRAKDFQLIEGGSADEREANDPIEILDQKIYDFISAMPR